MKNLSLDQLEQLKQFIAKKNHNINLDNDEFIDHLASIIEFKMSKGIDFDKALEIVLSEFSNHELSMLNLSTYDLWNRIRNAKLINKYGIYTGLALCIWIFVEYLTGKYLNVAELGAMYGLLSMVILFIGLKFASNHLVQHKFNVAYSYSNLLSYHMKVVIKSSLIVLVFMIPYLGYVNTKFYGLYEGTLPIPPFEFSMTTVLAMSVGVLSEGFIVSLIASWWQHRRMRLKII